jgi:REP element-mobilizing transposase RayT
MDHRKGRPGFYSSPFAIPKYSFITICTFKHRCILGTIISEGGHNTWKPTEWGRAAMNAMELMKNYCRTFRIDHYVVMPNHIHMLVSHYRRDEDQLGYFVNYCKQSLTQKLNSVRPSKDLFWQSSFTSQKIRNETTYSVMHQCICEHQKNWQYDMLYLANPKS